MQKIFNIVMIFVLLYFLWVANNMRQVIRMQAEIDAAQNETIEMLYDSLTGGDSDTIPATDLKNNLL
jgi:hypothetical protein